MSTDPRSEAATDTVRWIGAPSITKHPDPPPTGDIPGVGPRFRYRLHHYFFMAVAWSISLVVAALLVARWRPVDDVLMIAIVALTPFLIAPLGIAVVSAWFSRNLLTRLGAAAVTSAYLFTVAPLDAAIGCRPTEATDVITIMTANVYSDRGDAEAIADNVVAADPDILVLQEANSPFMSGFSELPQLSSWTTRSNDHPDAPKGVVVWSKWPMSDVGYRSLSVNASVVGNVDTPFGPLSLAGIHTLAPSRPANVAKWQSHFDALRAVPTDRPTIMAGDFNATEDHYPFRRLLSQGWTDVHDNKGCGFDSTWPANRLPVPVMRLDHILVTDDFEVLSTRMGSPGGSDHLPVIAEVRFRSR